MATELMRHLSKQLVETQTKYTYFLLAVAASAIALVVQRTTDRSLDFNMILLGLAVMCWAGSFFAGCRNRTSACSAIYANAELVQIQNVTDRAHPSDETITLQQKAKAVFEDYSSRANHWGHLQFRLLVCGAIVFLIWHVLEMSGYSL